MARLAEPDAPKREDKIAEREEKRFDEAAYEARLKELREHEDAVAARQGLGLEDTSSVREREDQGSGWKTNVQEGGRPASRIQRAKNIFVGTKKKGVAGVVTALILAVFGFGGFFFGGALAPVAFFANVTDDLDDTISAVTDKGGVLIRKKVSTGDAASMGCTKIGSALPIKCRYNTMSSKMVERFEDVGIEVIGETGGFFGNRTKPTSFRFQGIEYPASEFTEAIRNNRAFANAYRRAHSFKFLSLSGPAMMNKVYERFGASKAPPDLTGSHQDRINQLMNKSGATSVNDLRFTAITEPGSDEVIGYTLDGDSSGKVYTPAEKASIDTSIERVKIFTSPISQGAVAAVNIIGIYDLTCTIKDATGSLSVMQKAAVAPQLVQYVAPTAALSDSMKAGYISNENAQVLQEAFNDPDVRETILGLKEDGSTGEIPNPHYGKTAMDTELYRMSANGGVAATSIAEAGYSLGFGASSLIKKSAKFADVADSALNLRWLNDKLDACGIVQNGFVRAGGVVVGVVTGLFSGGATIALSGITAVGMITLSYFIESALNRAISNNVITDNMDDAPVDRGAALWTGMAAMHSQHALSRGMMPGNTEQIIAYQAKQNQVIQDNIAFEKSQSNPLDVRDYYSLSGTIAYSIHDSLPSNASMAIASLPTSISSFVFSGLSSILNPYSAKASSFDPERFEQCDDASYKAMNINADVQCNVRYVMPEEVLAKDPMEVALWMEGNNPEGIEYVEPDTTTGLPKDFKEIKSKERQNYAIEYVKGIRDSIYDSRDYVNDYGKFLDFCVNRILPFGETYEETNAINSPDEDWKSGRHCLKTESTASEDEKEFARKIDYFRAYTFDKSVNDDLDESPILGGVNCGPSSGGGGTGTEPTLDAINARIAASEAANGWEPGTSPLGGKGQAFLDLGQKYGINPGVAVAILQRESQLGTDRSVLPTDYNNFGGNTANPGSVVGTCGYGYFIDRNWKKFCTAEEGLEGLFQNLDASIYRSTDGTLKAVFEIYAPPDDGNNYTDIWKIFNAVGEDLGMTINESTQVYTSGGGGGGNCRTATGGGAGFSAIWGGEPAEPTEYAFGVDSANGLYGYGTDYGLNGLAHTGIDVVLEEEAPLYSPVNGTVTCAGTGNGPGAGGRGCAAFNDYRGQGNGHIQIEMDNGHVLILGHTSTSVVQPGDRVTPGQQVGTTGFMNSWHVHVEYRIPNESAPSGYKLVDPREYLDGVSGS